jgi:dTDP-4-amino-4,6-dideoxygalactose transaminase
MALGPIVVPVYEPYLTGQEKKYVDECLDSLWISKGPFTSRFETQFAQYIGASGATTVCNGTVALHLALLALGIGPGDEVIVPTPHLHRFRQRNCLHGGRPGFCRFPALHLATRS